MQQVHHGPGETSFFDIHLENVPQIVHRRTRQPQHPLLFDRGGFRVALGNDDSAQGGSVFTGHFLPRRLTLVNAEIHLALLVTRLQENTPAIFGHLYITKLRPAIWFHAGGGSKVDVVVVALVRSHVVPPTEVGGLPMLQSALQNAISSQIDVIGDFLRVVDHCNLLRSDRAKGLYSPQTLSQLHFTGGPLPYTLSAPFGPTAFGRMKIQFCQAERRPKTLVSSVSVIPKRRLASSPVRPSGERAARDSMAWRISSSQSRSSGAAVTSPASRACLGESLVPILLRSESTCAASW